MQIRTFLQLLLDLAWREALVSDNDPSADVIVTDERWITACVNAVAREYFSTHRLHPFDVVGIQNGYLADAAHPRLAGVSRQVIDLAVILLQRSVDSNVMVGGRCLHPQLIKLSPPGSVHSDPLKQTANGIPGHGCTGIILAYKRPEILRPRPICCNGWFDNPKGGQRHHCIDIGCVVNRKQILLEVCGHRFDQSRCTIGQHVRFVCARILLRDRDKLVIDDVTNDLSISRLRVSAGDVF